MVRPSWVSNRRRARVRLFGGGESRRIGGVLLVGQEDGVAPEQADQREVAVQARPGAALVVAQTQLLLAVLMEAFHRPAAMAELELTGRGGVVQAPGDVPLGFPLVPGHGPFAKEPTERTGHVAVGAVDTQPTGLTLGRLVVAVEHG